MKASSFLTRSSVLAILLAGALGEAHAQLEVRLSIKVVLQEDGTRPTGGTLSTDAGIRSSVAEANRLLASFGRGYQYRITEILDLPGHTELLDLECQDASDSINAGVQLNPVSYLWRIDAVNVYINRAAEDTGSCAFNSLLVLRHVGDSAAFLHEGGHHLGLCHTQGCGCTSCSECLTIVDDGVDDTLPDRECWNQDAIAFYSYGLTYAQLTNPTQRLMVSNTFNNVMAYHKDEKGSQSVFTSGQWDHLADFARRNRSDVMNGKTVFVDRTNTVCVPLGFSQCSGNSSGPFPSVGSGVAFANNGDIVLIRRGHYNEPMTITKPVALRATRGDAVIGKP